MSPMEALRAATAVAAHALRRADRIGVVGAGKQADLLLFDGDPLTDIESLQDASRIALVIKGGCAVEGHLQAD